MHCLVVVDDPVVLFITGLTHDGRMDIVCIHNIYTAFILHLWCVDWPI
jgi:hypothetical protein